MQNQTDLIKLYYFRFTSLWKNFCELHQDLLDQAVAEYNCLLSGDMEGLEEKLTEKTKILSDIKQADTERNKIIRDLSTIVNKRWEKIYEVIEYFSANMESESRHLGDYNDLLIELIEKIQAQNKRNQIFLNKALINIKNLRKDFSLNKTSAETYNKQGEKVQGAR